MTKTELKHRISQAIDQVPESVLVEILEYLDQLKTVQPEKLNLSKRLGNILKEDKELLQRLAL